MSVTQEAINKIKAMIISGDLRPGARLPKEADLAEQLGLSRNSLREAVRALTLIRILETRQGDGTYVTSLEPSVLLETMTFVADFHQDGSLLHVFQVRRILESAATSLAAQLITDEELETLDELVGAMDPADGRGVRRERSGLSSDDCASPRATRSSPRCWKASPRARHARGVWRGITQAGAIEQTKTDHRAIYDALRHHRPDLAGGLAIAHIGSVESWFEQTLRSRGGERAWRNVRAHGRAQGSAGRVAGEPLTDWEAACASFAWPVLDEFNWALDWFDPFARGNAAVGLLVVEADGSSVSLTFDELATRSDQLANWLRAQGVARGDRIVLMLGNQVELWETMLAAIKLGAVVIPATTLLAESDLRDRIDRGNARHVVVRAADAAKFDGVPGRYTRIAVGGAVDGWLDYSLAYEAPAAFVPDGPTRASDTLLLYFTSGTTARPKLVEHTHASYPVGHLSTMYWLGLQARRRPPEPVLARLGQARVVELLRALARRGDRGDLQLRALRRGRAAGRDRDARRDDLLRAADRLADADPGRPVVGSDLVARGRRRRRAAEPGGHRAVREGVGPDAARRLRPDRDDAADRQLPRAAVEARLDGPRRCPATRSS